MSSLKKKKKKFDTKGQFSDTDFFLFYFILKYVIKLCLKLHLV